MRQHQRQAAVSFHGLPEDLQLTDRGATGLLTPSCAREYSGRGRDQLRVARPASDAVRCAPYHRVPAPVPLALNVDSPRSLSGLVKADGTSILEPFLNKRTNLPRKSRERGSKAGKCGLSTEQIPVIVMRGRTGATLDAALPCLDAATTTAALGNTITRAAEFSCDGGQPSRHSRGVPG